MKLILYYKGDGFLVGRDKDGLGWCRFQGGASLPCDGCGTVVKSGYIARNGQSKRCPDCVEFVLGSEEVNDN